MNISKYNTLNSMAHNNSTNDVIKHYAELVHDEKFYNLLNLNFKGLSDDMINLMMIYYSGFETDYIDDLSDKLKKELENINPKFHGMIDLLISVMHH